MILVYVFNEIGVVKGKFEMGREPGWLNGKPPDQGWIILNTNGWFSTQGGRLSGGGLIWGCDGALTMKYGIHLLKMESFLFLNNKLKRKSFYFLRNEESIK